MIHCTSVPKFIHDTFCADKKVSCDSNSPTCNLSQNGYSDEGAMQVELKTWPLPSEAKQTQEKLTAPEGLPGGSPTPVLTGPCAA